MKRIRLWIILTLITCFLLGISTVTADENGIDLSDIQSRDGFSFSDDKKADWTYYSIALANGTKGETVEIMLVSWGRNNALTYHPEIRFFASDANEKDMKPQKATLMIGSNMFEINLKELSLDNVVGSYAPLVWEDDIILKALATGDAFQLVLQCDTGTIQARFTDVNDKELKTCASDMVRYDFTRTIDTGNNTDNLSLLLDESVITAYIFEELDKDGLLSEGQDQSDLNAKKESALETKGEIKLREEDAGKEKWGFIDKDGHVMIYPEYDFASPFYCNRARVFVGTTDSMGYPSNGRFGFIDRSGESVIPITYDYAWDFNTNKQAIVQKNGKYGVIDTEGDIVIPFEYAGISFSKANALYSAYTEDMSNPNVRERCVYYLIDSVGHKTLFGYEQPSFEDGCIVVCSPAHDFACALFSLDGKQLTEYAYEDLKNFSEGVGRYKRNGKYGLISTTAEELTAPMFDQVGFAHAGRVVAMYKGEYCLIDLNGNILQTYEVDQIRMYDALQYGVMCALEGDPDRIGDPNNRYYLLTPDGKYISRPYKHTIVFAKPNVFYELEDGVHYILDSSGKETVLPVECKDIKVYGENRFFTYKDKKYAFVDLEGHMITQYIWSDVKINEEDDMDWICVCY